MSAGLIELRPLREKDALAPTDHLVAGANRNRDPAGVEIAGDIGIQQFDVALGILLGVVRQSRAIGVGDGVVVKIERPAEEAQIIQFELQLVRHLGVGGDEIALAVVEIAVVAVDRVRRAAVGGADQTAVPPLGPHRRAGRNGGVEISRDAHLIAGQFRRGRGLRFRRACRRQQRRTSRQQGPSEAKAGTAIADPRLLS